MINMLMCYDPQSKKADNRQNLYLSVHVSLTGWLQEDVSARGSSRPLPRLLSSEI